MLKYIETKLLALGLPAKLGHEISVLTVVVGILIVAIIADIVTNRIMVRSIRAVVRRTKTHWDDAFINHNVFARLAHIVPALLIYSLAPLPFPKSPDIVDWIKRAAIAYMVLVGLLVINAIISACLSIYQTTDISRQKPLKSYAQVLKIITTVVGAILVLATLLNRSALGILGGLGAMTAIIILVFKDSILGFVAGIQLAANDMVRKGDWIEMSKFGADGEILDISLTTIKIQNWDKTITTIPTYSLVADSFKNWRGMSESRSRRIKRSFHIDMNSIRFCTPEEIERFTRIDYLQTHIQKRKQEIAEYNKTHQINTAEPVNGRKMTNIGVFRAYILNFLKNHAKIHQNMTLIVRHLKPEPTGLPIEIYCFSNDTAWSNYENIQADIFDHLLAVTGEFGLKVFQNPTGTDMAQLIRPQ